MSAADWRRARRWSRRQADNLPGFTGNDLLQEAICKFLTGERAWKRGVPAVVALCSVMRSISSNVRKSSSARVVHPLVQVDVVESADPEAENQPQSVETRDDRTPYDAVEAKSHLDAILKSVEGDEALELVAMAWMDGLRGKEAAEAAGLDGKSYDAARKKLMRKLDEFREP